MIREFDERRLIAELERLPVPSRIAFAASCAERQMRAHRLFRAQEPRANAAVVERALEDAWTVPDQITDAGVLERQLEEVMALIPQEDNVEISWTQTTTNAQNAAMAVAYTLRTRLSGDAQEAAWAARVAYEALDNFVINTECIDPGVPGGRSRILMHPLVQAELERQERDMQALLTASESQAAEVRRQLRDRAKAESAVFFGAAS